MPINDFLTPVDVIPGLSDGSRQDVVAPPRDGNNSSSEYQRALSRTLSRDDRREQTTSARTDAAETSRPPTPADSRSSQRSEDTITARPNSESQAAAPPSEGEDATVNAPGDQAGSGELQNNAISEETASDESEVAVLEVEPLPNLDVPPPVIDILTGIDELPVPPADLSSLYGPVSEDETPTAESVPLNENGLGDAPLIPPAGLFELPPTESSAEQQGSAIVIPSNEESPTFGSTPQTVQFAVAALSPQQEGTDDFRPPIEAVTPQEVPGSQLQGDGDIEVPVVDLGSINSNTSSEVVTTSAVVANRQTVDPTAEQTTADASAAQDSGSSLAANLPTSATTPGYGGSQNGEQRRDEPTQTSEKTEPTRETVAVDELPVLPPAVTGQNAELAETAGVAPTAELETLPEQSGGSDSSRSSVLPSSGQPSSTPITASASRSIASPQDALPIDAEQFVDRVAGAVRSAPQNGQQLRVRLYPPHLGAMQIEVTSNNGTLSVRMEVQSVAAQSALSDNMSALREALVQQGNSLDRIDVQLVETNAEEGRADLTDEQQQQQQAEEQSGEESEEQSAEVEAEDNQVPSSVGNGLDELDIQV